MKSITGFIFGMLMFTSAYADYVKQNIDLNANISKLRDGCYSKAKTAGVNVKTWETWFEAEDKKARLPCKDAKGVASLVSKACFDSLTAWKATMMKKIVDCNKPPRVLTRQPAQMDMSKDTPDVIILPKPKDR